MHIIKTQTKRTHQPPALSLPLIALTLAITLSTATQLAAHATVLKGRIEQIYGTNDPKLPELKAIVPKLDTSQDTHQSGGKPGDNLHKSQTLLQQQAISESYPIDWKGDWYGELTIMDSSYVEPTEPGIRDEIDLERKANTAGRKGKAKFSFRQTPSNAISLEPISIQFVYPSNLKLPDAVHLSEADAAKFVRPGERTDDVMIIPDRTYYITMNNLQRGITVGGNLVSQKVLRNTVNNLAKKVIEQDIVTMSTESLHDTSKIMQCFNEDVLRFTMINQSTIMVQAVALAYNDSGHCDSRISFAGYVQRH